MNKIKRHDTLVMAAGVVTATILCGAFVYVTTPAISADAAAKEVRKDSLGVQKKANDQLNEINSYLERLDSVVTGSQELMREIQNVQSEQSKVTNNSTSKENTTNNTKVVEKISGLDKELELIHTEIKDAATLVKNMSDSMEKGDNKGSDKDKAGFTQINNALGDIKKSCDDSSIAVSGLVAELKENKKDNDGNSKQVIGNLEKIQKGLSDINPSENLGKLEKELLRTQNTYMSLMGDMEKKVDKGFENVEKNVDKNVKKVEKGVSDIEKGVSDVDSSVSQVLETQKKAEESISGINASVGTVNTNISSIFDKLTELDSKLDQSFNKVASEKDKLASTLATLGVDIKEEGATFADLDEAIKKLPRVVLKNAEFTYTRHEHVDKNNNIVKGEVCSTKGGCFTIPTYHVHDSSCFYYKKMVAMLYRMAFTKLEIGMQNKTYVCDYCGKTFDMSNMNHECMCDVDTFNRVNAAHPEYVQYLLNVRETTQYTQKCTKSTTAVQGYAPSCKHRSGEILSAEINFDEDDSDILASHVMEKKDEIYDGMIVSSRKISLEELLSMVEDQRAEKAEDEESSEEVSEEEPAEDEDTGDDQNEPDRKSKNEDVSQDDNSPASDSGAGDSNASSDKPLGDQPDGNLPEDGSDTEGTKDPECAEASDKEETDAENVENLGVEEEKQAEESSNNMDSVKQD
ncbi:MAG: hypothetical protein K6G06_00150 [Butyrivibrio sp.]|nr:hypothetical protein [Butyrivibrio sp.]